MVRGRREEGGGRREEAQRLERCFYVPKRRAPSEGRHGAFLTGVTSPMHHSAVPHTSTERTPVCVSLLYVRIHFDKRSRHTRRHRRARGRPSSKEKHPPTTLESLSEGDQGSMGLLRRGRAGMTTPPSVVDGCAEPSVDGMAPQESGAISWRHRFRRRRARLAPSSRPILL